MAVVLAIAVIPGLFRAQPAGAGLNGEINGQVRDVATGVPLVGAEVRVSGEQLHSTQVVRAGGGGSFRAPGLPPGDYHVEATMDGYVTSVVENLVLVTGGVLRVDFAMREGSSSALDLVSSPLLDVVTGSDGNVLTGADLRQLPGRVASHSLDLAAGIDALDGDVGVSGWPPGFATYRIDGQESALRSPGAFVLDPHWVDQIRVRTMDLSAAMAGPHIDLVTRSGSTRWQVDAGWSTIEPLDSGGRLALRLSDADAPPIGGRDRRRLEGDEATFFVGGPLRDKRARAFGGVSRSATRGTLDLFGAGAPVTWSETVEQSVAKFDWWAGSASNLTLKHHSASGEFRGRRPGLTLPSADGDEETPWRRQTTSLNVEWGITDRLWLRVFGGRSDLTLRGQPWSDAGTYLAAPAGGRAAGWFEAEPAGGARRSAGRRNWAVEPSFFLGDHTLEVGVQAVSGRLDLVRDDHPRRVLRIADSPVEEWRGRALAAAGLRHERLALHVHDAWRVGGAFGRRLTLHAGLRAERETAGPLDLDFDQRAEPRLGFVWDVAGRGRWKIHGGASWWHLDTFRARGGFADLDAQVRLEADGGIVGSPLDFDRALVDPDLRPGRVRELQLGTGYQFLPEVVISARLSRRRLRDGIRLIPVPAEDEIVPVLLTPGRGAGAAPWGDGGGRLPRLEQDWWGAELIANLGLAPSWKVHFSYLLSRLTGNHERAGLGALSGGLDMSHPALLALDLCSSPVPCDVLDVTREARSLAQDREHQMSGWLVLSPGDRIRLALVYRFRSGAPTTPLAFAFRVDEAERVLAAGLAPVPEGAETPVRSSDLKRADLSLTWLVPMRSENRRLSLFAEALNVFDQDAAHLLWPLVWLDPVRVGLDGTDIADAAALRQPRADRRVGLPAAFQQGRRVRAGLRLQF